MLKRGEGGREGKGGKGRGSSHAFCFSNLGSSATSGAGAPVSQHISSCPSKSSIHVHQLDLELLVNSQDSFAKWLLDSLHDVHAASVHHCMVGAVQKICHHFLHKTFRT